MASSFAHIIDLPIFQIYSPKEVKILQKQMDENLKTKKLHQEMIDAMPPEPNAAEALTAKAYFSWISALGDGGTSLALSQVNINKMLVNTTGILAAMDEAMMKINMFPVYSRWATPSNMRGSPVIVDILAWLKASDQSKLSGVQVKANTELKIKVNQEKPFTVKEGKTWNKTWFRGRENQLFITVITTEGEEVELSQVLSMERGLPDAVLREFNSRWNAFVVPKTSG